MRAPSQSSRNTISSIAAVGSSCAALIISFLGVAKFDLPITKYVRSVTIHLPWDQLTVPWMAFTSDMGDWIGQGWRLTTVSVLLLLGAWAFEKPTVKIVAIQSLVAHGIAALLANGLKHLIGRPRPKFVHAGDWQMTLSWASGLDSFPSGHSTASFAIATVLAKRFPLVGPFCIVIALFVALSRVLRGSHFPTDILGGAVIGILSGFIATAPLRQWRTSIQDGLRYAAMGRFDSVCLALGSLPSNGRWNGGHPLRGAGSWCSSGRSMDTENSLGSQGENRRALALEYLSAVDHLRPGCSDDLTACSLVGRIRLHGILA